MKKKKIAMICSRLGRTDGVSLEMLKWFWVLSEQGHEVIFILGEKYPDDDGCFVRDKSIIHPKFNSAWKKSFLVPEMKIKNKTNQITFNKVFVKNKFNKKIKETIETSAKKIEKKIEKILKDKKVDLIIAENYSLPMTLSTSVAITSLVKKGYKTIYHNHDFWWERKQYKGKIDKYLLDNCPHISENALQVVINKKQLKWIKTKSKKLKNNVILIQNVFDVSWKNKKVKYEVSTLKKLLGIKDEEVVILAPARIIKRKNLEAAIDLIKIIDNGAKLIISGYPTEDRHSTYFNHLKKYAKQKGIKDRIIFMWEIIRCVRKKSCTIKPSLFDAYNLADLVVYPSLYEGFGNAFIESVFEEKIILINRYEIYDSDLRPMGFKAIEIKNGKMTQKAGEEVKKYLVKLNKGKEKSVIARRNKMIKNNLRIGKEKLSKKVLNKKLKEALKMIN